MPSASTVSTTPFAGQKPGTSGLRKKVSEFLETPNYVENFLQCTLEAVGDDLKGSTLVVGGDGRYGVKETCAKIVKMAAANGVKKLIVGQNGILSTPALSNIIRKRKVTGGIILTASHNPGGPKGDFGIKYNLGNGGPAPTDFTERIYSLSQSIKEYKICSDLDCDISKTGESKFTVGGADFEVEVVDSISDYVTMCKEIFDFPAIKGWIEGGNKILINSLHGVTGPYAERIFGQELGAGKDSFMKTELLPDFGNGHPDPNLTYARDLVEAMEKGQDFCFGAAFDGDGDRNMILGKGAFFVTPCDSLAVIAENLDSIPYFAKSQITGYARSMPTSGALDRVAKAKGKVRQISYPKQIFFPTPPCVKKKPTVFVARLFIFSASSSLAPIHVCPLSLRNATKRPPAGSSSATCLTPERSSCAERRASEPVPTTSGESTGNAKYLLFPR